MTNDHRGERPPEETHAAPIRWTPPEPRRGMAGGWDRFIGPGATPAELWIQLGGAVLGGVAAAAWPHLSGLGWPWWKVLVAALFGLDLVGGVLTNATNTAQRWYHRPGQGRVSHLGFVALHVVHLALVAWLFRGGDVTFAVVLFLVLMAGAAVIVCAPLHLQRPLAALVWLAAVFTGLMALSPTPGLEWFVPVFFYKLLISHAKREAPFAAPEERTT